MSKTSEKRRQDILDAAAAEFVVSGVERVSMSEIAARAKIGKSTIYEYFPSKNDLFAEVCQRKMAQVGAQLQAAFQPELSFRDQLSNYCHVMLECFEGIDFGSVLVSFISNPMAAVLSERAHALLDQATGLFEQSIRRAQARGEVAADVNATAAACWLLSLPNPNLLRHMQTRGVADPLGTMVALAADTLAP